MTPMLEDERKHLPLPRDDARRLRREQTDAEHVLWTRLRAHRFLGLKFRRQHQMGPYIVDFCCIDKRLVIELDGSQHQDQVVYDEKRTRWLNAVGFRVIRFWNHEVLLGIDDVLDRVEQSVSSAC